MKWISIIEEHREELGAAIERAYRKTIFGNSDLEERVSISEDGEICEYAMMPGSTPADEYEGRAICVFAQRGWQPEVNWAEYFQAGHYFDGDVGVVKLAELLGERITADFLERYFPTIAEAVVNNEVEYEMEAFRDREVERILDEAVRDISHDLFHTE